MQLNLACFSVCFLVTGLLAGGGRTPREFGRVNPKADHVSIVALLAGNGAADRSPVRTVGVARFEFEGNQLCLSKEAFTYRVYSNCLALQLSEKLLNVTDHELRRLSGSYVLVEGTFDRSYRGHLSMNPAGIRDLSRLLVWEEFALQESE